MPEEINPAQQRGVSVDVLAERISNLHEQNRSEFSALHHHLAAGEAKVDSFIETFGKRVGNVEAALHDHTLQQHHPGTETTLIQMAGQHTDFERKFGEHDRKFAEMERANLIAQAASDARLKQRTQGLTALEKTWLLLIATIPVAVLLWDRLV